MAELERYRAVRTSALVSRILENPELVSAVRELPPAVLGRLVERVGLEDSGELVALASSEQLAHLFDEDLWQSEKAGEDPRFDGKRFGVWLEILLEAGERALVERMCELPFELLSLCVQRLVLVIDIDALGVEMSSGGEDLDQLEKALDSNLYEEWEEYRLIAREASAWDAVLTALLALDREHHALLRRILERCADMSAEYIDDNGGLYQVLTSDEMLEVDARAERDDRRAAQGYVAPSDATAFLKLARSGQGELAERDPVTRAYFRELARAAPRKSAPSKPTPKNQGSKTNAPALLALLESAGVVEGAGASKPQLSGRSDTAQELSPLARALAELRDADLESYAARLEELGFLANVLIAGESRDGRRLRPPEAVERALAVCNLGLERALAAAKRETALAVVRTTELDRLFRRGLLKG